MNAFEEIHEETVRTEADGTVVRTHRHTVRDLSPEEMRMMAEDRMREAAPPPEHSIFDVFRPSPRREPPPAGGISAWFAHVRPSRP